VGMRDIVIINGLKIITILFIKSLLPSLGQREEFTPPWQRGVRRDFPIDVNSISKLSITCITFLQ
jgi:hypothetical protein